MANPDQSEPKPPPAQVQAASAVGPVETPQETQQSAALPAEEAQKINEAVGVLESQLAELKAKEHELEEKLAQGGSESSEAADAQKSLSDLRDAKTQVEAVLSAVKTGKKPVSSTELSQISRSIGRVLGEATEESAELGAATSGEQSQKTNRSASATESAKKKSPAVKVKEAVFGKSPAEKAAEAREKQRPRESGHDDDDDENVKERFIITGRGREAQRKVRKVRGNGTDRSIVNGLTYAGMSEDVADEVVWGTQSVGRKTVVGAATVVSGAGEILSGDVEGAKKAARATSRGVRRTLDRFIGDENAEAAAHAVGNVLETAGVAGATTVSKVKDGGAYVAGAAKSLYDSGVRAVWGEPEPKAKPKPRSAIDRARDAADINGNGIGQSLTTAEVRAAILGAGKTIAQADRNRDGVISNEELAIATGFMKARVQVAKT